MVLVNETTVKHFNVGQQPDSIVTIRDYSAVAPFCSRKGYGSISPIVRKSIKRTIERREDILKRASFWATYGFDLKCELMR